MFAHIMRCLSEPQHIYCHYIKRVILKHEKVRSKIVQVRGYVVGKREGKVCMC